MLIKNAKGLSLIELVISVAIISAIIAAFIYLAGIAQQRQRTEEKGFDSNNFVLEHVSNFIESPYYKLRKYCSDRAVVNVARVSNPCVAGSSMTTNLLNVPVHADSNQPKDYYYFEVRNKMLVAGTASNNSICIMLYKCQDLIPDILTEFQFKYYEIDGAGKLSNAKNLVVRRAVR